MHTKHKRRSWCDTFENRPKDIPAELDINVLKKIGSQLRMHYDSQEPLPEFMETLLKQLPGGMP